MNYYDWVTISEANYSAEDTGSEKIVTIDGKIVGEEDNQEIGNFEGVEVIGQAGFVHMPLKPDKKGSCQALVTDFSGRKVSFFSRDSRGPNVYGNLKEGDTVMWSPVGTMMRLTSEGEAIMYKQGKKNDTVIAINKDGGIDLAMENTMIQLTKDAIKMGVGGTSFVLDEDGLQVMGKILQLIGMVELGVAPLQQVIVGPSGIAGIPSPSVKA